MDDLSSRPSPFKRLAAAVTVVGLIGSVVNVAGWASTQVVGYSQMRTELIALREAGPVALARHTEDATRKFVDQEKRLTRVETRVDDMDARLQNIHADVREILRELRAR